MSFQNMFDTIQKQDRQLYDQYMLQTTNLPQQLQKMISQNEKRLQLFIQNFQSEIIALKKSQQRDNQVISNTKFDNKQRITQSKLLQNAMKMQQQLVHRLQNTLHSMQQLLKNNEQIYQKHQQNQNRYQIDIEDMEKKEKNKKNNQGSVIQVDRENGKLYIRVDKNGSTTVHQICYNCKEDRFGYVGSNRGVGQAVISFQFHRNIGKLYEDLISL